MCSPKAFPLFHQINHTNKLILRSNTPILYSSTIKTANRYAGSRLHMIIAAHTAVSKCKQLNDCPQFLIICGKSIAQLTVTAQKRSKVVSQNSSTLRRANCVTKIATFSLFCRTIKKRRNYRAKTDSFILLYQQSYESYCGGASFRFHPHLPPQDICI